MKNDNLIIAFTEKTGKILPRIFCRRFRHCCVLFPSEKNEFILVQIGIDGVRLIPVGARELRRLEHAGWVLVGAGFARPHDLGGQTPPLQFLTCVGFAKRATGINNPFIWTPDQLYRKLKRKNHD